MKWLYDCWTLHDAGSIASKEKELSIGDSPRERNIRQGFQRRGNNEKKIASIHLLPPNSGYPLPEP